MYGPGAPAPQPDTGAVLAGWGATLGLFAAAGLLAGAAQVLALGRRLPARRGWVAATVAGWLIAAPLAVLVNLRLWFQVPLAGVLMLPHPEPAVLLNWQAWAISWEAWALLSGAAVGLAAGAGQWACRCREWGWAGWRWVGVSSAASGLAWLAGLVVLMLYWQFPGNTFFLYYLDGVFFLGRWAEFVNAHPVYGPLQVGWAALSGAIAGLVYAVVTGPVLLWLLRERRPDATGVQEVTVQRQAQHVDLTG
jgi:hypothetical protein